MLFKRVTASFLCLPLFAGAPCSYAAYKQLDVYGGASINKNSYKMKSGYGKKIFKESPKSYEGYIGHRLNDNSFIEFAYEQTSQNHRINTLSAGEYAPGKIIIPVGTFDVFRTSYQLKSPSIYFGYSTSLEQVDPNLEANIAIGLSWTKLIAKFEVIEDELGVYTPEEVYNSARTFKARKIIPSIRAGAAYKINDAVKFKVNTTWKNLARMNPKSEERPALDTQIKMKNSLSFGLGFEVSI